MPDFQPAAPAPWSRQKSRILSHDAVGFADIAANQPVSSGPQHD